MIPERKKSRRVFKWLGGTLAFLFAFLLVIWIFPTLVLNDTTLKLALGFFNDKQASVQWNEGHLHASSSTFFTKRVSLRLSDFCAKLPDIGLQGCFPVFDLSAEMTFKNFGFVLTSIGPAEIQGAEVAYQEVTAEGSESSHSMPVWLKNLKVEGLHVSIAKANVRTAAFVAQGKVDLTGEKTDGVTSLKAVSEARVEWEKKWHDAKADIQLRMGDAGSWEGKAHLESPTLRFQGTTDFSLRPNAAKMELVLTASLKEKDRSAAVTVKALGTEKEGEAQITLMALKPTLAVARLESRHCELKWKASNAKTKGYDLKCPLTVAVALSRPEDFPYSRLLRDIVGEISAHVDQKESSGEQAISGQVELTADPVLSEIKDGTAHIVVKGGGKWSEPFSQWRYQLESKFAAKNAKRIIRLFEGTAWAVPKPIADLDGGLELDVTGEGNAKAGKLNLPLTLKTNLSGQRQKLDLNLHGNLFLNLKGAAPNELNLDVGFEDVQLMLPPLDPYAVPKPVPDRRIERQTAAVAEKAKKAEKPFQVRLTLRAAERNPIRLISGLSPEVIPISFMLKASPEDPLVGDAEVKPFELELFRRKAKVEYLRAKLKRNPDYNTVQGKIVVPYVDYTISIMIDGLLTHPSVHFESDPPLSDKQLIAVLLFGRSLDSLDNEEMESVGNARSALADGAVGLASMYALASTPVESIGYDSLSQEFSAKIKLADKTSLTIGTDLKQVKTLGVRRKLGAHWDVNTYLENPFLTAERSLTTFLEWNWRY